ncbi:M14 family metallocarboxypeptidase [Glaciecola sp. XM2]|jgi:hypothetical protein|uniref:M14 family metallopeptidase n=1 Tax=Glaciecola sp. XM2 TaxID=1914931 RepID=UPI001BDF5C93|nr:M14 family metallocarboxypeptidase [Glaciecola sp. XM2]MBT1450365.1 M14 family metallocarboxypeptidase [Glaciecola sp. XM2]
MNLPYAIGTAGKPWGDAEKQQWRALQTIKRSYREEVLSKLNGLDNDLNLINYGALPYNEQRYPLFLVKNRTWQYGLPTVLITGGVHGYETSGVQGAILFLQTRIKDYLKHFNFIVAPCVSPWGYESINRWNPLAVDPNRSFFENGPSPEANALMRYMSSQQVSLIAHFDLHETTDTDNTEFRPALAARDALVHDNWEVPDGFYTVGDTAREQSGFQKAIIDSVRKVTHIAPADQHGKLIGSDMLQPGVINYDKNSLFLCGGFTDAPYVTTTEVYPDSPKATPQQCNLAQVAALEGGLQYLI